MFWILGSNKHNTLETKKVEKVPSVIGAIWRKIIREQKSRKSELCDRSNLRQNSEKVEKVGTLESKKVEKVPSAKGAIWDKIQKKSKKSEH